MVGYGAKGADVFSLMEPKVSPMEDPEAFYNQACDFVKNNVHRNEKVGLAVSGGVDSTTVARILRDSIGDNLVLIHMDHGFLRYINGKEESYIVVDSFKDYPNMHYRSNVRNRFYKAVASIEDGDRKRAAFREIYKAVLNESMGPLECVWTADGTIKPDIVETRGGIKLQHNVDLGFVQKKLEPLAALTKQEVRTLAKYLGLPHLRQPFPGPGLLVRTVGVYSPEKLEVEKKANDIVEQEYRKFMMNQFGKEMIIYGETGMQIPFQNFAATFDYHFGGEKVHDILHGQIRGAFLKTKVTSLVDDGKRYERIYKEPFVILDLPPARAKQYGLRNVLNIADATGSSRVLCRLAEKSNGNFAVAIRAVDSIDVRTAKPNLLADVPERVSERIINEIPEVKSVMFDVTPKPPATVEYE